MHLTHLLTLAPGFAYSAILKRIVGGQAAELGQFPSLVSLTGATETKGSLYQFCGGALLNPTTVLTAAHCVEWVQSPPAVFGVRAGSLYFDKEGVSSSVASYVQHPDYNQNYDFAILKLTTPIEERKGLIEYARLPDNDDDPVAGSIATVAGWGLDGDGGYKRPDLYWVNIPVIDRKDCSSAFAARKKSITEEEWCAHEKGGGKGDCDGDSGGAVYIDNVVQGLVSWSSGCADAQWPSVYARVSRAMPFIRAHL
ncbi:trypsin-like serine protease [Teratosphaeria nubilosa]|uniref:Trypsin-like serine protease n=1 Tax=Teratosphaeria nubilosa TaxID=161662 RepID=A0A6G1LA34_9PEZI|nr:trypsin-like serine protease [Teratosphaeria nubilosa]